MSPIKLILNKELARVLTRRTPSLALGTVSTQPAPCNTFQPVICVAVVPICQRYTHVS